MAGKSCLKSALAIVLLLLLIYTSATVHAKTIYVDDDGPADFDNIQAAIDAAVDTDIIVVSPGTYTGDGNRDIDYSGKAITVRSTDPNDPNIVAATIIDCQGSDEDNHRGFYFRSGEDENSILEGLTITNGFHTTGAGICCRESSPTIRNNIITGNEIGFDWDGGAGIGCWYGASPTITNNIISNNKCAPGGGGGGIRCYEAGSPMITNNTISGNFASQGGGILIDDCNPFINNCIIADNSTVYQGGGILISMTYSGTSPKIYNSTFTCNSATAGSGIYIANWGNDEFTPTLTNCIVTHNSAIYKGGGMYCMYSSPILTNCVFNGNSAGDYGGGVYNYGYCSYAPCHRYNGPTLKNCTFYGNLALDGSALACDSHNQCYPSNIQITNCILSDGGNEILIGDSSHIMAIYSNIHGGWPGEGNMDVDPLFHDHDGVDDLPGTEDDNLRLLPGSPCIDAGDPNYIAGPNETDLDGKPRVIAGRIDMGAYEFLSQMILYVDDDAAGANDGSSWADAFNFLQDALATAYYGDEIHVAQGTYKPDQGAGITPGDREATFQLSNGVTIKGGYAGFGQTDPNARHVELYETVLTGDLNGDDADADDIYQIHRDPKRAENSYHVLSGSGTNQTAVLDGFVVTGGNADGIYTGDFLGAGLANYSSGSPTIVACIFKENLAYHGGGIHNGDSSNPTLIGCKFIANESRGHGAGVYNEISSPIISRCTFTANKADGGSGAGVGNFAGSSPNLTDCIFFGNFATGSGGGIFNTNSSNPNLTNCEFTGNSTKYDGGGMYNYDSSPNLINCTFSGNSAGDYGYCGGVYNDGGGNPMLTNCILWGNMDKEGVDESAQIYGGQPFVSYTCIQGLDMLAGNGNIGTDPCFVDLGYWQDPRNTPYYPWDDAWVKGDYHLLPASMCIDAGDPNYIAGPGETDLNGRPRVMGDRIDMGAYEMPILAEARILPQTINLASKGNWINCYIWLPDEYDVADMEQNSLFLEDEIQPEQFSVDQQQQVATARFNREDVLPILEVGDISLKITGQLSNTTYFQATDKIKVIDKAVKN